MIDRIAKIGRISWRDLALTAGPLLVLLAVAFWITSHFVHPAPPDTITITSGPEGSTFAAVAERYRKILARQGVKLKVVASQGSLDNLRRLADRKQAVDIGFVQGGLAEVVRPRNAENAEPALDLVSLGSLFYVPVYVFYKSPQPMARLSELEGKRIAMGREGSGTRALAEIVLKANGVEAKGQTKFLDADGEAARDALVKGEADAAFLMGDSARFRTVRELAGASGVRLFDFKQADAYQRRFRHLAKLEIPAGSIDLGKNLPPESLALMAATVELVARPELHPALSDMLIEAAREVHSRSGLLQKAGEFPAPLEHEYPISDDAHRYYKSGKTFAYKHLPFWLASLVDRIVVVLVPLLVLLIPGLKLVPWAYRWRINQRIYRRYAELMTLERAAFQKTTPEQRADLLRRLDEIEGRIISLKLPGSFAEQVYILRQHLTFVRNRIAHTETLSRAA